MKALVVYESMFGNTQQIAQAVAAGLGKHVEVEVTEVGVAPDEISAELDLLVVGAPTHAFGMSRASTRADAVKQAPGGTIVSTGRGVREWLETVHPGGVGTMVAAFDTRVRAPLPGSAAHKVAKALQRLAFPEVSDPETFWVKDSTGPLKDGELERAERWGSDLGLLVNSR